MPFIIAGQRRRWLPIVLLAAMIAIGSCGSDDATVAAPKPVDARAGAAAALVQNAHLADRIVGEASAALARRMAALRGHPVVVNRWASWCDSCRFEFRFFQTVLRRYGDRVSFIDWIPATSAAPPRRSCARCPSGFPASSVGTPLSPSHSTAAGHGR